jgi:hypothetical protein
VTGAPVSNPTGAFASTATFAGAPEEVLRTQERSDVATCRSELIRAAQSPANSRFFRSSGGVQ